MKTTARVTYPVLFLWKSENRNCAGKHTRGGYLTHPF